MDKLLINTPDNDKLELINHCKKLSGAVDYDGDYSTQVYFELKNGKRLRIGMNDEGDFFIDQYEGLGIIGADGKTKKI